MEAAAAVAATLLRGKYVILTWGVGHFKYSNSCGIFVNSCGNHNNCSLFFPTGNVQTAPPAIHWREMRQMIPDNQELLSILTCLDYCKPERIARHFFFKCVPISFIHSLSCVPPFKLSCIKLENTENGVYRSSCPALAHGCRHRHKNPKSPSCARWQNLQLGSEETGFKSSLIKRLSHLPS